MYAIIKWIIVLPLTILTWLIARGIMNFLYTFSLNIVLPFLLSYKIVSNFMGMLVEFIAVNLAFTAWIFIIQFPIKVGLIVLWVVFGAWLAFFGIAVFTDLAFAQSIRNFGWNGWHWTGQFLAGLQTIAKINQYKKTQPLF